MHADHPARAPISPAELRCGPLQAWTDWFLLTAGDFAKGTYNAMTVSWGSWGIMWGKPFIQVVVRPTRHTRNFIDTCGHFTLTAFPAALKPALNLLGTKSGRDGDKLRESGLRAMPCQSVASPTYAEAELSIEAEVMYHHDLDPGRFLDPDISKLYDNDFHRSYFGRILKIEGTTRYRV